MRVSKTYNKCKYVGHYLVTCEQLIHQAFMFRGVVAVMGGCEGPVWTGAEKKRKLSKVKVEQSSVRGKYCH